ncbi:MAG: [FeFe] hydrogenase H-cluster radical SAM maturase HydE [Candidatus Omnitrophica bacterium CG11_big_fil_rev_8_21_14_0_20_43_6]|nr:MAG: [FeFe] hydrogenase H-cluster radical SAM maturase HydE [Candidatus Omnitrophica bacterium CG11_big_fil_rev_8_21_14_0_20_43_6]
MCYAIPGKIEKIEGNTVIVDYFGEKRKAFNELTQVGIGDYIYAQGGYAIQRIPKDEAKSILAVWKETFFELQEVDLKLSRLDLNQKSVSGEFLKILDKASEGKKLSPDELLILLKERNKPALGLLFKTANFLRQKYHKNSCCVHGIIEISNYCRCNCDYCGIANGNKNIARYRLTPDQILEAARQAIQGYGFKALVLQSGQDSGYSIEELAGIIRKIKANWPALIFISFGEVGLDSLKILYDAGARGLLLRFETSNPELYKQVNAGKDLASRIAHLKKAYELGYLVITGGLIGLPQQNEEDLLNDILLTKELHAEMYSFGPFIMHPQTPLAKHPSPEVETVLKVIAISRIIDAANAKIPVTTALETLHPDARREALLSGANSVMLNVTPLAYRPLYNIYPARAHEKESIEVQIKDTIGLLMSLGRSPTDLSI